MDRQAQGFVETAGLVAAIQVADIMAKTAEVRLVMAHKVDGLRVCVMCEGDVAACKAAVDAGAGLAESLQALLGSNVIPRPDEGPQGLKEFIKLMNGRKAARKAAKNALRSAGAATGAATGAVAGKALGKATVKKRDS